MRKKRDIQRISEEKKENTNHFLKKDTKQSKNSNLQKYIRICVSLLLGFTLLFIVYRSMDLEQLFSVITNGNINWWIIIATIIIQWGSNIIRGLRWRLLILPLTTTPPKKRTIVLSILGCYTINVIFPRAGEIWRCGAVARYEKMSVSQLIGTVFIDRLMDVLVALLFLISGVVFFSETVFNFLFQQDIIIDKITVFFRDPRNYFILLGVLLLLTLLLVLFQKTSWWGRCKSEMKKLIEGIRTIQRMKDKSRFIIYTVLMWTGYFLSFYLSFFAFQEIEMLGIGVGVLAFTMGTLAGIIPVQGSIGTWHFCIITTLVSFGIHQEVAGAFAFIVHASHIFGMAIIGVFAILLLPLLNRKYKRNTR